MHCIKSHAKELCTVSDYKLQEGEEILEEFVIEQMEMKPVAVKRKNVVVHKFETVKKPKLAEVPEDWGQMEVEIDDQEIVYEDQEEEEEPPTPPPARTKKVAPKAPVQVKQEVSKKVPVVQKPPAAKTLPVILKESPLTVVKFPPKKPPVSSPKAQKTQEVLTKLPKGLTVKSTAKPVKDEPTVKAKISIISPQPSTSTARTQNVAKPAVAQKTPNSLKSPKVAAKPTPIKPASKLKIERVKMTREEIDRLKAEGKIEYDKSGNMILTK